MGERKDALWRVGAFLWSFVAWFVFSFALLIGIIWGAVDVAWQLVTGRDGLSASSTPAMWVTRFLEWPLDLTVYAVTGDGQFELVP